MKAAVVNEWSGRFDIEDVEIGLPQGRELLIQVKASGLCHSDLHVANGNVPWVALPAVLGHELAGIVVAAGEDVTEFALGDHVVGSLIQACGQCEACDSARPFHCSRPDMTLRGTNDEPRLTRLGRPLNAMFGLGAFAEYALVHENQLARIPRGMPFPQAAIIGCATCTGAGAVINTAGVKTGQSVAIIGAGGVGLNAIMAARNCGASRIIAIDRDASKESLARRCGATDFVCSALVDPIEAVAAITGHGTDHVFDVVGVPTSCEAAVKMARVGGCIFMIGAHQAGVELSLDIQTDLIFRQLSVKGVYMGSSRIKHDIPMYADLYLQGRLDLDALIDCEIDLAEINEAYDQLKLGRSGRAVITSFSGCGSGASGKPE